MEITGHQRSPRHHLLTEYMSAVYRSNHSYPGIITMKDDLWPEFTMCTFHKQFCNFKSRAQEEMLLI